ncbi:MAG: NAD(P)/FAD-dependent oxidoreductase, partial [Hyphomicrobium sp.]|nr:NAD(P)/FAD-dependent oxidoreductase [Hyphomicrobium sp.]
MINRRQLLISGAASMAAAPALAQPAVVTGEGALLPRDASGRPRIVIAGGGWGGLSAARHLREQVPNAEVIVLERNPVFWSCPI